MAVVTIATVAAIATVRVTVTAIATVRVTVTAIAAVVVTIAAIASVMATVAVVSVAAALSVPLAIAMRVVSPVTLAARVVRAAAAAAAAAAARVAADVRHRVRRRGRSLRHARQGGELGRRRQARAVAAKRLLARRRRRVVVVRVRAHGLAASAGDARRRQATAARVDALHALVDELRPDIRARVRRAADAELQNAAVVVLEHVLENGRLVAVRRRLRVRAVTVATCARVSTT